MKEEQSKREKWEGERWEGEGKGGGGGEGEEEGGRKVGGDFRFFGLFGFFCGSPSIWIGTHVSSCKQTLTVEEREGGREEEEGKFWRGR